MASICGSPVCAGGKPKLKFTYTGDYVVRDDGVVELHSSGILVFIDPALIDLFMVGGGGGGGNANQYYGAGGGGGGYTQTVKSVTASPNTPITVNVGAGGSAGPAGSAAGSATSFGDIAVANGGDTGSANGVGGNGGSGGGGGDANRQTSSPAGFGGSDGGNGTRAEPSGTPGTGQSTTTREFGEATGKLYSGGGGGGKTLGNFISNGGSGGGGNGANQSYGSETMTAATSGEPNTGGGGGGGCYWDSSHRAYGASGGSGIVCFREAAPLPELAGTWALNERLYRPSEVFTETINFEVSLNGTSFSPCTKATFELRALFLNITNAGNLNVYSFNDSSWTRKYKYWKFLAGATASDEFRAWLASNATKQA